MPDFMPVRMQDLLHCRKSELPEEIAKRMAVFPDIEYAKRAKSAFTRFFWLFCETSVYTGFWK